MLVKAVYEFEFDADVSDFDADSVDIVGLAEELTRREVQSMLDGGEIMASDFEYRVLVDTADAVD